MFGELHLNRVLYRKQQPGAKPVYRQIAVIEAEQFQVRIFEGEVVQTNPKFIAETSDAEVYMHLTLEEAMADAESEFQRSVSSREWDPYNPALPPF
jgi:hypothetical protein